MSNLIAFLPACRLLALLAVVVAAPALAHDYTRGDVSVAPPAPPEPPPAPPTPPPASPLPPPPSVAPPGVPKAGTAPKAADPKARVAAEKELLSKEDVLAYAKQVFGPGNPFADSNRREANLNKIRDHIKERGTKFLPDLAFSNEMHKIGASSVHNSYAIEANYGKHPKLEDYYGTYLLRAANRGTTKKTPDGKQTTTDSQNEAGMLIINKDKTFVWKIGRNDPEDKWVKGKWREVKADEMHLWEGGPAIWLEKARQNEDYMVRMCRVPDYEGWIDVGMGKGRIAVNYGRRP